MKTTLKSMISPSRATANLGNWPKDSQKHDPLADKKNMLFELALILPLYAIVLWLFFQFRAIIKIMTEFNFFDEVDTPREGVENREKHEVLKELITQGEKLNGKKSWTVELIDQASNEEVEKLHSKYTQKELQHKGEKTGKAMGKHLIKIYSNGVSKVLRIDDMKQLRKDIDEDPIIKDSMADIGALMVSTFGKRLSPILIACHTANHTQGFMTADYAQDVEQE